MLTKTPRDPDGTFKSWNTVTDEVEKKGFTIGHGWGLLTGVLAMLIFIIFFGWIFWLLSDKKDEQK